jgi:hypothetical protein
MSGRIEQQVKPRNQLQANLLNPLRRLKLDSNFNNTLVRSFVLTGAPSLLGIFDPYDHRARPVWRCTRRNCPKATSSAEWRPTAQALYRLLAQVH